MSTYPQLLTPEQDAAIAADHLAGVRLAALGRKYGVYPSSIRSALRRQGVPVDNYTQRFNEEAFSDLGSEHPCYWLGFLFADGSVGISGLQIHLRRSDEPHLEKFRQFLHAEQPLRHTTTRSKGKTYERVSFRVNDRAFGRNLARLGIATDRPDPEDAIAHIPDKMLCHWFRGLFDGDGCAHKTGALTFLGPKPILITLRNTLIGLGSLSLRSPNGPKIEVKPGICRLHFSGVTQCRRIAEYLYQDATVWMERKRDIIDSWTSRSYLKA